MNARSLLVLGFLAACAPTRGAAYEKAIAEAHRSYGSGRFADAATSYDQAAKEAQVPRDAVFAKYEAALARQRAGDTARAQAELRAIANANPPSAYAGQAAFRSAQITLASDPEAGYRELEELAVRFPDDGVAVVAIGKIARHDDEAGLDKTLAHMDRLATRVHGGKTGTEQSIVYERAKRLEALGRTENARDAYFALANQWPYPFGVYFDDALFHAAQMDEKLGRNKEAVDTLERLLGYRETSAVLGTYERPKYVPAILEIARLYEEKLNDRGKARETLHRLYADFKTSPLRDDALWREAELWRKDNDAKAACDRLATLASDFPDSKYVPCVTARCPSVPRPSKSKAPTTCRPYIERGPQPPEETEPPTEKKETKETKEAN